MEMVELTYGWLNQSSDLYKYFESKVELRNGIFKSVVYLGIRSFEELIGFSTRSIGGYHLELNLYWLLKFSVVYFLEIYFAARRGPPIPLN